MRGKTITTILFAFVLFSACTSQEPKSLIIEAPWLKGEVCDIFFASGKISDTINNKGLLSVHVSRQMLRSNIQIGKHLSFKVYVPLKGGIVKIDSAKQISFHGEFAAVNQFIQESEFERFDSRKLSQDEESFTNYVESVRTHNLDLLKNAKLKDKDYVNYKMDHINFSAKTFYLVYLGSKKPKAYKQKLQQLNQQLEIDHKRLNNSAYTYYLYRLSKELLKAKHDGEAFVPYEFMRKLLADVTARFTNTQVLEMVIHKVAVDYVFKQGNDPYLDKIYRKHVSSPLLKKQYEALLHKWDALWVGSKMKDVGFTDINGKAIDFEKFEGKYVVYDLWATWCRPCIKEQNTMLKMEKEVFSDQNISFVTLSCDVHRKKWESHIKNKHMEGGFHFNSPKYKEIEKMYAITTIPRFFLCDPSGNLLSPAFYKPSDPKFKKVLLRLLQVHQDP